MEDYKKSLNTRIEVAGEEGNEDIANVRYDFAFNKKNLSGDISLPLEYETNIASFMEKIDAQPVISFDDLEPFDPIE